MFLYRLMGIALGTALSGLSPAAPLTFSAALDLAERQSPQLIAQSARIDAAQAATIPAAAFPDPKLVVGIENLPLSGPDRGRLTEDFMTMQKFGLMQEVPNAAKREARKDVADAAVEIQDAKRRLARLMVRRETAQAWVQRFYLDKRLALFDALVQENRLSATTVNAQLAGGIALVADAVLPRLEAAELDDQRDELTRERTAATAMLRRWVGAAADEPLAGGVPFNRIDAEHLRQHGSAHPQIALFEPMARLAMAEVREAEAAKQVDWEMEVSYGRRGEQFGDMMSVQFRVDLPAFPQHRQDPLIRAKHSERGGIEADRAEMVRIHFANLESQLAEYEMLTRQTERMHSQRLPLARENLNLKMASYRAGNVPLSAVLDARREWINQRLKAIALEGKRTAAAVQLHIFYGEEQP